eukprot:gene18571-biopygen663
MSFEGTLSYSHWWVPTPTRDVEVRRSVAVVVWGSCVGLRPTQLPHTTTTSRVGVGTPPLGHYARVDTMHTISRTAGLSSVKHTFTTLSVKPVPSRVLLEQSLESNARNARNPFTLLSLFFTGPARGFGPGPAQRVWSSASQGLVYLKFVSISKSGLSQVCVYLKVWSISMSNVSQGQAYLKVKCISRSGVSQVRVYLKIRSISTSSVSQGRVYLKFVSFARLGLSQVRIYVKVKSIPRSGLSQGQMYLKFVSISRSSLSQGQVYLKVKSIPRSGLSQGRVYLKSTQDQPIGFGGYFWREWKEGAVGGCWGGGH